MTEFPNIELEPKEIEPNTGIPRACGAKKLLPAAMTAKFCYANNSEQAVATAKLACSIFRKQDSGHNRKILLFK